jgi:hypothetical protein
MQTSRNLRGGAHLKYAEVDKGGASARRQGSRPSAPLPTRTIQRISHSHHTPERLCAQAGVSRRVPGDRRKESPLPHGLRDGPSVDKGSLGTDPYAQSRQTTGGAVSGLDNAQHEASAHQLTL